MEWKTRFVFQTDFGAWVCESTDEDGRTRTSKYYSIREALANGEQMGGLEPEPVRKPGKPTRGPVVRRRQ